MRNINDIIIPFHGIVLIILLKIILYIIVRLYLYFHIRIDDNIELVIYSTSYSKWAIKLKVLATASWSVL